MKEDLKKAFAAVVAYEKANSRKITAALTGLAVKSIYGKAAVAVLTALLGLQS
jgi:hypothetical protein